MLSEVNSLRKTHGAKLIRLIRTSVVGKYNGISGRCAVMQQQTIRPFYLGGVGFSAKLRCVVDASRDPKDGINGMRTGSMRY